MLSPLPAVMVTVGDSEENNLLTVAWTGILSTHPPRAYISVRPGRHSHKFLGVGREFVINLTTESLARTTDFVGVYTGAKMDKFEKCNLTRIPSKCVAPPTIAESPLALECRVFEVIESGTHNIFLADIVNVSCDESIIDQKGKICLDKAGLMAYAHGEYYALGRKLGNFGFSTAKQKAKPKSAAKSSHGSPASAQVGAKKSGIRKKTANKPKSRS